MVISDFCGWSNAPPAKNTKQVLWTRNTGETESENSGPERDHTTETEDGWYIYVPEDAQSDGVAVLQSELLGPYTGQVCFSFYYNIQSETRAVSPKLTVLYVSPEFSQTLLNKSISSHTNSVWNIYNVSLINLPQGRFQLKTILGQVSKADVAIDDISIKPGLCGQSVSTPTPIVSTPEPVSATQWDCNFETTSCKWKVNGTGWVKASWNNSKSIREGKAYNLLEVTTLLSRL